MEVLTAISKEAQTLDALFIQLQTLVSEFHLLSVEEILKRLVAIIIDGTLSSLQNVLAILKILFEISQIALSVLDTKIHIPVISWILKKKKKINKRARDIIPGPFQLDQRVRRHCHLQGYRGPSSLP